MADMQKRFLCEGCGQESAIRTEKIFGPALNIVGERYVCGFCGCEVQPQNVKKPHYSAPKVLDGGIDERLCRNCENYFINPFTQRCALHRKEVMPLDTCEDFNKKEKSGPVI